MAQPNRIGTKAQVKGRRKAAPRTGRGTFPPHPSFSSNPPHKLPPNPQVYTYGLGAAFKAPVPPGRLGRILNAARRGRKTAVVSAENVCLGREDRFAVHNAWIKIREIVPDEVVLAWRRDYLNGKTAQEWVLYANETKKTALLEDDPICPICGNAHTGDSCVVDPGI